MPSFCVIAYRYGDNPSCQTDFSEGLCHFLKENLTKIDARSPFFPCLFVSIQLKSN
jgi:hypothetical protein